MNLAVTPTRAGSEPQHLSYDTLHHNNSEQTSSPVQHRRHVHYTTPDAPAPRSPRQIYEPAPPSNSSWNYNSMSRPSPAPSSQLPNNPQESEANDVGLSSAVRAQDHDRMETDMDSDDSESGGPQSELQEEGNDPRPMSAGHPDEIGSMDTSPDSPSSETITSSDLVVQAAVHPQLPSTGTESLVQISSNGNTMNSDEDDVSSRVVATTAVDPSAQQGSASILSHLLALGDGAVEAPSAGNTSRPSAAEILPTDPFERRVDALADTAASGWDSEPRLNREGEREEDTQDEESEEEEFPFWSKLREDESGPDEQELIEIENTPGEVNALDHDHWERLSHEPLDDPEYIPGETGRIFWTVNQVNGTPEKPNMEIIMKSPSVLIGGYYWNIKYYPRGNGTEQMSVYIECSTSPYEDEKADETTVKTPIADGRNAQSSLPSQIIEDRPGADSSVTAGLMATGIPGAPPSDSIGQTVQLSANLPKINKKAKVPWEVAAQASCVVYNPQEPRVHASQRCSHRYYNENPDWGWTRFHGPWEEIHKRQRLQRQALLRNDTLVFAAYVRIVKDDTGALWWHPPKTKPEWDSVARTGLRRLESKILRSNAIISAIAAWIHLPEIVNIILGMHIPDRIKESKSRPRPLFEYFQDLLVSYHDILDKSSEISLEFLVTTTQWYGAEINSKMDVVAIWETLRRLLNYEASDVERIEDAHDVFGDIVMLKQPDPWESEQPIDDISIGRGDSLPPVQTEPNSVQQVVNLATSLGPKARGGWGPYNGQQQSPSSLPAVLQIELHRQSYHKETRKWTKLTHQVSINEVLTVDIPSSGQNPKYTLFGMVVHSGDLESQDYFTVVRPRGPGTRWVKYAGDKERKGVTCLTRKQAVTMHEGVKNKIKGNSAVAYIVLYVRTDLLSTVIDIPEGIASRKTSNIVFGETAEPDSDTLESISQSVADNKVVSVYVHPSIVFTGYSGRGYFDTQHEVGKGALELTFSRTTTLAEVGKHIIDQALNEVMSEESSEFRLWVLNMETTMRNGSRYSPMLSPIEGSIANMTLAITGLLFGGCHFWLHKLPKRLKDTTTTSTNTEIQAAGPSSPLHESTSGEVTVVPEMEVPEESRSIFAVDLLDPTNQQDPPQMLGDQGGEDTIMEGASDLGTQLVPDPVAIDPSNYAPIAEGSNQSYDGEVYIFLKTFDHQGQRLTGMGTYIMQLHADVKNSVRDLLGPDYKTIDICHENMWRLGKTDGESAVKPHQTFYDRSCHDGEIFVVQRRPSPTEIATLEAEGKCTRAVDYWEYLHGFANPSFFQDHLISSYFGSRYISASSKYGRPHGPGVSISMSGDAYSGEYASGQKSGHGTMAFANGDTYTGEWNSNEPNGQGKMVYATTGNTYVGGFKKRKRHGKGTMRFEVADEEMQLCKICYEQEMDALFYDCGHVAACEDCARQVEVCPVCRKGVRAVVRIWRT